MLKSSLDGVGSGTTILCGSDKAPQRVFIIAGQHGQEIAPPEAIASFLEEERDNWRWPNVQACFVWDDMVGYTEEGYGFVSTEGEEGCWPPSWRYHQDQGKGYWMWYDRNSTWGNITLSRLPPALQGARAVMNLLKPTFCLSLHETVHSEVEDNRFWAGALPLLIETWPLSLKENGALLGAGRDLLGEAAFVMANWVWSGFSTKYLQWIIRDNPHYRLITDVVGYYQEMGNGLTEKAWMEYLKLGGNQVILGPGRILSDPRMATSEWRTVTGYAAARFGCPGITIETFPTGTVGMRGLDVRVQQHYDFIVATLETLERKAGASQMTEIEYRRLYEGDLGGYDED